MRTSDRFRVQVWEYWSAVGGSPLVELCSFCDKLGMDGKHLGHLPPIESGSWESFVFETQFERP